MVSRLVGVHVLLLPGPAILEPDLRHALAQSRDLRDPLEVLPVGVRVDLEVGLQDLDLIRGAIKSCNSSLALPFPPLLHDKCHSA